MDDYVPNELTHEQLHDVHIDVLGDGDIDSREFGGDCSVGCKWFHVLEGDRGMDWGVCGNVKSPRAGMLTFEHDGCDHLEIEDD